MLNGFERALRAAQEERGESIGVLLDRAASIALAIPRSRAHEASDEQLAWGLRALIPMWDEERQVWL